MLNVEKIRKDFPIFDTVKELTYLDSASTTQKPNLVIDKVCEFYRTKNANVARGLYTLSEEATVEFENVREQTAKFINAGNEAQIIFTKNTTESMNLIMRGWGEKYVKKGDRIVTTIMEHHSNFVPWQQLARRTGAKLQVVDISEDGRLDETDLEEKMNDAKMIAVSAASNVVGTINDVKKIVKMAHDSGAVCIVDGAQSVPGMETNVKNLDCDFLAFSGHKMLAPFGVGVLYGKQELLEEMDPFMYGSEMIREVKIQKSTWNDLPHKFEPGTPDVGSVLGLGSAIEYLNKIGMENIRKHEEELAEYMLAKLQEIKGLKVIGPIDPKKRTGLAAFTMEGVHPHDVAAILNEQAIAVRSGHHCAMPLNERLGINATTRSSTYIYNSKGEIDKLVVSLENVRKIFG